jgi:hypothetical protein
MTVFLLGCCISLQHQPCSCSCLPTPADLALAAVHLRWGGRGAATNQQHGRRERGAPGRCGLLNQPKDSKVLGVRICQSSLKCVVMQNPSKTAAPGGKTKGCSFSLCIARPLQLRSHPNS